MCNLALSVFFFTAPIKSAKLKLQENPYLHYQVEHVETFLWTHYAVVASLIYSPTLIRYDREKKTKKKKKIKLDFTLK